MRLLSSNGRYSPYDDIEDRVFCDGTLPLDPIHVAGRLDPRDVITSKKPSSPWYENIVTMLIEPEQLDQAIQAVEETSPLPKEEGEKIPHVRECFRSHLEELIGYNVLERVGPSEVTVYGSYFEVVKPGEHPVARTIFDGRRASARMPRPAPVNISDAPSILSYLAYP
jgi:hypothetical protein